VPRRLILRPGAIGDTVVSLPALQSLRAHEIWAPAQNLPLLRHLAECRSLVSTGIDSLEIPKTTLRRLAEFEEIFSWYGSAREDFRQQVAALPFRFFPALPAAGCGTHAVDFYLRQVGAPYGAVPRLPVHKRDGGFAVIHPFSGSARKNWPLEQFRAVAEQLPMPVHWCAGPEETLDGATQFGDLSDLIHWLAGARVFLGNDSGIAHVAAACGVPVVAVFGPTDPRVWAPRGNRVRIAQWDWPPERVAAEVLSCC
jgi:heptosyltransferase III